MGKFKLRRNRIQICQLSFQRKQLKDDLEFQHLLIGRGLNPRPIPAGCWPFGD